MSALSHTRTQRFPGDKHRVALMHIKPLGVRQVCTGSAENRPTTASGYLGRRIAQRSAT